MPVTQITMLPHYAQATRQETECLNHPLDLYKKRISNNSSRVCTCPRPTSKNLFSHQTWNTPSASSTPNWKILHHLTLAFVLSAVFLCVLSLTTIYPCSSLTCATSSESCRTVPAGQSRLQPPQRTPDQGAKLTFLVQRILRRFRLGHVDDSVHVERHLLGASGPVLVAEAVRVPAVLVCGEGVIAGGDAPFVDLVGVCGGLYLRHLRGQMSFQPGMCPGV